MKHRKIAIGTLAVALIMSACGDSDDSDTTSGRIDRPATTQAISGDPRRATETTAAASETTAAATETTEAMAAAAETTTTQASSLGAGGDESADLRDRAESPPETTIPGTTIPDNTRFEDYGANPFEDPEIDALSTFAVDVDTGSYTLMRAWVNGGVLPPTDSVRVGLSQRHSPYRDSGSRSDGAAATGRQSDAGGRCVGFHAGRRKDGNGPGFPRDPSR